MYIRTLEERNDAVKRLLQNKKNCKRYNIFGEDNYEKIDIMIDVIKNERDDNYIYQTYPSCNELDETDSKLHSKYVAAINARDYLKGEFRLSDLLYPDNFM